LIGSPNSKENKLKLTFKAILATLAVGLASLVSVPAFAGTPSYGTPVTGGGVTCRPFNDGNTPAIYPADGVHLWDCVNTGSGNPIPTDLNEIYQFMKNLKGHSADTAAYNSIMNAGHVYYYFKNRGDQNAFFATQSAYNHAGFMPTTTRCGNTYMQPAMAMSQPMRLDMHSMSLSPKIITCLTASF
jgi:hypothetical protein